MIASFQCLENHGGQCTASGKRQAYRSQELRKRLVPKYEPRGNKNCGYNQDERAATDLQTAPAQQATSGRGNAKYSRYEMRLGFMCCAPITMLGGMN